MSEKSIEIFVKGLTHYFNVSTDTDIKVGSPYLNDNESPIAFDFTGIIGISGNSKGCVYFTAPRMFLKHLLISQGEIETHDENLFDLVGEVANTISGNARKSFGHQFMISVPVMVQGAPEKIHFANYSRSYVIPVYWKAYSAALVVCLDNVHT